MRINYQSAVCLQQNTFLEFFFINISLAILENTNYGIREERTYLHASGFFATGMRGMDYVRSMCSVYRIPVTTDMSWKDETAVREISTVVTTLPHHFSSVQLNHFLEIHS